MIVVSDTSPICYLVLINGIDLLPQLYGQVAIPQSVLDELRSSKAPSILQEWIAHPPEWLKVESVVQFSDPTLEGLDLGEKEAILLAETLEANLVILDEQKARKIAQERGLTIIGILGILYQAALRDLIDLDMAIQQLKKTNFRASNHLFDALLSRYQSER